MPTTTPLTDAINALTTYANGITGQNDPDLSSAVATLGAGYGGGGGLDINDIADGTEPSGAVVLNTATTIKEAIFKGAAMTSISSTTVTSVGVQSLYACASLGTVFLPNATCSSSSIRYCTALTTAVIGTLQTYVFNGDTSLTNADLVTNGSSIAAYAFYGCTNLTTIVIRSSTVCSLANINAFNDTPFASGGAGGTIYVPSSLISSYQSATNWSTIHGYGTITWKAIEGSQYETTYADGTAIS